MSKQNSISHQSANDRSSPIELSEQQLDSVAGGTKAIDHASPNLFARCCTGKHIPKGLITAT